MLLTCLNHHRYDFIIEEFIIGNLVSHHDGWRL